MREQVCPTTYAIGMSRTKSKGASAVKLLRPLKLSRKVFRLPGSIWREDNPAVPRRQPNSHSMPVKICGQVCKIGCPSSAIIQAHFPLLRAKG
ncbi:MAG: hypothetical protein JWO71_1179 [Candidatus Acidoferrum typicum]|nr:hypothetical protein [Candidatus Acidoferrum typicum]